MVSFRSLAGLCAVALLAGATPAAAQIAGQPWASLRTTVPLPPQTESGRVDVGDVDLYYAIYGKGRPEQLEEAARVIPGARRVVLRAVSRPPINWASSRLMLRPSPVPP